jgi:hypothetical protein
VRATIDIWDPQAQTTRHVGSYDDCKSQAELLERVEQDLGGYWALFRKAVQSDDPGAVIDAEVIEPAAAEQQPEPELAES